MGVPPNRWFISWKIRSKWLISGYPHFRKPPFHEVGNIPRANTTFSSSLSISATVVERGKFSKSICRSFCHIFSSSDCSFSSSDFFDVGYTSLYQQMRNWSDRKTSTLSTVGTAERATHTREYQLNNDENTSVRFAATYELELCKTEMGLSENRVINGTNGDRHWVYPNSPKK